MFFARRTILRCNQQFQQRRTFGATSAAEAEAEMNKWKKIFWMVGLPICAIKGASDFVFHHDHHDHGGEQPDYMKIRNKEYSWECGDCNLFDSKCWKKCREEKA